MFSALLESRVTAFGDEGTDEQCGDSGGRQDRESGPGCQCVDTSDRGSALWDTRLLAAARGRVIRGRQESFARERRQLDVAARVICSEPAFARLVRRAERVDPDLGGTAAGELAPYGRGKAADHGPAPRGRNRQCRTAGATTAVSADRAPHRSLGDSPPGVRPRGSSRGSHRHVTGVAGTPPISGWLTAGAGSRFRRWS